MAHVAASTSKAYVGPWNAFVLWCGSLLRPRRPLPADDITVALYLQSIMDTAKSFSTIKSASASIAFFHKINLFTNHPTGSPEVCMVRTAAARKFGLSPKRVKDPFLWLQLVDFALLYGVHNQGYCHLVITTMAILSFGAMCRYSDVSQLKWENIHFESDLSSFTITFERRKNSQFRQGNKVTVAATKDVICPLKLLLELKHVDVNATPTSPIFCGFNGRLVAKSPNKTTPYAIPIKYDQYVRYLSLWFGEVLGMSTQDFKTQYGSQSGRSGGASAASNAGIPIELWGQHGDWASFKSQKRYMKKDIKSILSVSLAAMEAPSSNIDIPIDLTLDVRDDSGDSDSKNFDDSIPSMDGIPANAFCWHGDTS